MIVKPRIRGDICTTAHPKGCFENVKRQVDYVKSRPRFNVGKKVLVIGCSTGYGLASRICCAFGQNASTVGVMFERRARPKKTATAGWYNTAAFETIAKKHGLYAKTINGDAFSTEVKNKTIDLIKSDLGKVDMIIYSLAAPRRVMPDQTQVSSVLKTIGKQHTGKTLNLRDRTLAEVTIPCATQQEIDETVKVMGGGDWKDWDGTIGAAKDHLLKTANEITNEVGGVKAYISVNKALVTQSSAAIPIVPLYITVLYKIMKDRGVHENCIEQMYRLFGEKFGQKLSFDEKGRIRIDDYEMKIDIQQKVLDSFSRINNDNVEELADIDGYWQDFYEMFGFGFSNVDYDEDVDIDVDILSID